ncbi:TPA: isoleucine--tRNA ligase [bacterium]|nr:isoleucine--tRNA ligase [bacterium]
MLDISQTVNLPKTDFPMKAGLSQLEPKVLGFWDEIDIYKLILEKNKGKERYVLHDGPPYANGHIHLGHALNKILKDIIVKYKAMSGFDTPYVPGWDCHGLPIEHKVMEKESRDTPYPLIRMKCREYARKFINVQRDEFRRLGVFGDWDSPYQTFTNDYVVRTLGVFKNLVRDGFVYKDKKPVFWCKSCKTALAEAEVEYKEDTAPSIYVKFPYKNTNILIWTTTPWTLFGNTGIAIHPEFIYQEIEYNGGSMIVFKDLVENIMKEACIENWSVKREILANELDGEFTDHPFLERKSKIVLSEFVLSDQGTGCVHIAPGHGIEDYETGVKYELPLISPVDDNGCFTEGIFIGEDVFHANKRIIEYLEKMGMLFLKDEIFHSYPHCWRCKKPVIFRATSQWFIKIDHNDLRRRIIDFIDKVEWIPDWGKNRFFGTISSRGDWCISRQRAWGIPIPSFYCENCETSFLTEETIERAQKLVEKQGSDKYFEIESDMPCPKCGVHNTKKETDILDVWFDSGSSHCAVLKDDERLSWPADLYLEGSDQHRGWFQSSIITSVACFDNPPYKGVLTHGFILDEKGYAMSKSQGNVIPPQHIIEKYGADVLRLWVSSIDFREDMRIGEEILKPIVDSYRKIRNTIRFLLGNLHGFECQKGIEYENLMDTDRYVLDRLQGLIENVNSAYERFEFHIVYREILNFCTNTLSNFYLDILKDRLYCEGKSSIKRRSAQTVLYELLVSLLKLIAPILSFTVEEAWGYILDAEYRSVFLCDFPKARDDWRDEELREEIDEILKIRDDVNKAIEEKRKTGEIGSSLEVDLTIHTKNIDLFKKYEDELCEIFIVSSVEIKEGEEEIGVKKHGGVKCPRCWIWSYSNDSLGLCLRCRKLLESMEYEIS